MTKKKYQCQQCGYKFAIDVFEAEKEKQEWERRNRRFAGPVRCEKCRSGNVVEIR